MDLQQGPYLYLYLYLSQLVLSLTCIHRPKSIKNLFIICPPGPSWRTNPGVRLRGVLPIRGWCDGGREARLWFTAEKLSMHTSLHQNYRNACNRVEKLQVSPTMAVTTDCSAVSGGTPSLRNQHAPEAICIN